MLIFSILFSVIFANTRLLIVKDGEVDIDLERLDDLVSDRYGNKLKYFFVRKTWHQADKHCRDLGGYLATVEDRTKNYEVLQNGPVLKT